MSYFCSLLLIIRCEEVSFGSSVDQSVLYLLMKESLKNHVLKKSYNQYGKSPIELIRITPNGVIRISQSTSRGNSDHSSKNDWHLFPHLITHLLFNVIWKTNYIVGEPKVSSMGPENISMNERTVVMQYLQHWYLSQPLFKR